MREARHQFKKSVKKYNVFARSLVTERSRLIKNVLVDFRGTYKKEFAKEVQNVKKHLKIVRDAEEEAMAATQDMTPEHIEQYFADEDQYTYCVSEVLISSDMTQPDPLDRSFWFR